MQNLKFPTPDHEQYLDRYLSFIAKIAESRENMRVGYMEEHHIIPKSLFDKEDNSKDAPENLIYLTPREHYIAHKLLARAYEHNHKIVSAFWYMSTNGRNKLTPAEYEEARIKYAEEHSRYMAGENNPFYKKVHTREAIEKMKSKLPDYTGENNPFYGQKHSQESLEKMRNSHRGMKLSEEHKSKISKSLLGNKRRLGYVYSEEEKQKLRERVFTKNCKACGNTFQSKSNFVTICNNCKERGIHGR